MEQYTELKDRILWFDGDSTIEPNTIADMLLKGTSLKKGVYVSEVTDEIREFNKISADQLTVKTEVRPLDFGWNIPEKYLTMNLNRFLLKKLDEEVTRNESLSADDVEVRIKRVEDELQRYYESNLHLLLRTAIYIIDTFREKKVVWGIGRGSACSSYILYLVGVHDIDSVLYELDITDFLR
jgi:DNA polymerase III alpha subunit